MAYIQNRTRKADINGAKPSENDRQTEPQMLLVLPLEPTKSSVRGPRELHPTEPRALTENQKAFLLYPTEAFPGEI